MMHAVWRRNLYRMRVCTVKLRRVVYYRGMLACFFDYFTQDRLVGHFIVVEVTTCLRLCENQQIFVLSAFKTYPVVVNVFMSSV